MKIFNNSSRLLSYTETFTGKHGVILPYCNQILFESDINIMIRNIAHHIIDLTNCRSHHVSYGGKKYISRKISLQNQIGYSLHRLKLLKLAKELILKRKIKLKTTIAQDYNRIFNPNSIFLF